MDSDDFIWRFATELKSYAPVVLPTLVIFAIESGASLKVWHAVQQLPHHEKDFTKTDSESNIDSAHQAEITAIRKAVKKVARREAIQKLGIFVVLLAISFFEQYVAITGMLKHSRGEDDEGDYTSAELEQPASGLDDDYSWYYDSTLGQIDWMKSYYVVTLFFPGVFLVARALYLLSGMYDRMILRDTKGMPFTVLNSNIPKEIRWRRAFVVILVSLSITAGALVFRNLVCSVMLFASFVYFSVSGVTIGKSLSYKHFAVGGFILMSALVFVFFSVFSMENSEPIRLLYFIEHSGHLNWSALFISALVCAGSYNMTAFCYRVDHAFAQPDELLVGSPDLILTIDQGVEVPGTRLSYAHSRFAASITCPKFKKPYFHAAILGWLTTYAIIAALKVSEYIACDAESAGVFALYIAPPVMSAGVLLCAMLRGEVKKLWAYKEEWARNPAADAEANVISRVVNGDQDEKPLIPEANEKTGHLVV